MSETNLLQHALVPYTRERRPQIGDRIQHVASGRLGTVRALTEFDRHPIAGWDGSEYVDDAYSAGMLRRIVNERPVGTVCVLRHLKDPAYTLVEDRQQVDDLILSLPDGCLRDLGIDPLDIKAALAVFEEGVYPEVWFSMSPRPQEPHARYVRVY